MTVSENPDETTTKERSNPMAKTKPPFFLTTFNTIIKTLLRVGVKIGDMTLLTVRGRKSGEPRTTPIWVTEQNGQRWVISPYGQVQWVRNLRAAGEATLTRGRHIERVSVVEPGPQEAAPLLKHSMTKLPSFLGTYFNVTQNSSLEEFEREVLTHPLFLFEKSGTNASV